MNLTRLSIACVALICIAGVAQQWTSAAPFPGWRLGAILLLLGFCYEWRQVRGLSLTANREEETALRLGREEQVYVRVHNEGPRLVALQYAPGFPEHVSCTEGIEKLLLPAGENREIRFAVVVREPGTYAWSPLRARVRGALGLSWWNHPLTLNTQLRAIPDLTGARGSAAGNVSQGETTTKPGRGQELHHLREYVHGDPRHAIDWKATARAQRMVTRVFSEEQHLEIMLVLDVGRTCLTRVEGLSQFAHYTNLAARFAEHAVTSGDHIGLLAAGGQPQVAIPPRSGMRAVLQVREALSRIEPRAEESDLLAAALKLQQIVRKRALIILLTDLYGQSLHGGFGRSVQLLRARHLPVVVGLLDKDVSALAERDAYSKRDVIDSLAASEYRNSLRGIAGGATQLGAHAIITRPDALEARVLSEYRTLKAQHRV